MRTAESITLDLLKAESGDNVVTAFRPFEPYALQTINVQSITDQRRKREDAYNAPQYKQAPVDKHEYWDWMQERAQERWAEMAQREEERQEEKKTNREEVLRVVEETWGHPPLLSLKAISEYDKKPKNESEESKES